MDLLGDYSSTGTPVESGHSLCHSLAGTPANTLGSVSVGTPAEATVIKREGTPSNYLGSVSVGTPAEATVIKREGTPSFKPCHSYCASSVGTLRKGEIIGGGTPPNNDVITIDDENEKVTVTPEINVNDVITIDDDDVIDVRLADAVNDSILHPLTMHDLNKVKNKEFINDAAIDCVLYKDVIQGHDDRILVSAVVWDENVRPAYWGPDTRRPNRLPTVPRYNPHFVKAIIPVNFNNRHWSLAILDKPTKICTFYCTMRYRIFSQDYTRQLAKLRLICRLLLNGEDANIVVAPGDSFLLQTDGYNCGPFIVMLAYRILNNETLFFGTADGDAWREYIYDFYIQFVAPENAGTNNNGQIEIVYDSNLAKKEIKKEILDISFEANEIVKNIDKVALNESQKDTVCNLLNSEDDKNEAKIGSKRKSDKTGNLPAAKKIKIEKIEDEELMDIVEQEVPLSAEEEEKLKKELKENFIGYCNRNNIKKDKLARTEFNASKAFLNNKMEVNEKLKDKINKVKIKEQPSIVDNEMMEVDENVDEESKTITTEEEIKLQNEVNETYDEFCKRKKIKKNLAKSKNLYKKTVQTAQDKLEENERIKEYMRKKRETMENKLCENEIRKVQAANKSQTFLKNLKLDNNRAQEKKRSEENNEKKQERLQKDAESKQKARDNETDEEMSQRLNTVKTQME